jgi:hypothetical protein
VKSLETHLAQIEGVAKGNLEIIRDPVDVAKGEDKPFEITVAGALVYSKLKPVAGECGPLLFESNKWWGEPSPQQTKRVTDAVVEALEKQAV